MTSLADIGNAIIHADITVSATTAAKMGTAFKVIVGMIWVGLHYQFEGIHIGAAVWILLAVLLLTSKTTGVANGQTHGHTEQD